MLKEKILICEDDKLWRKLLSNRMLDFADLSWVSSIKDAMYEINNFEYHGFIADLNLPDSSPSNTIEELSYLSKKIPTIIMSGDEFSLNNIDRKIPFICGFISKSEYNPNIIRIWAENNYKKIFQ